MYNGEINIIKGNCDWVMVCVVKFVMLFILDFKDVVFFVNIEGLDLLLLDNMLELFLVGGMDLFCVMWLFVLFVY